MRKNHFVSIDLTLPLEEFPRRHAHRAGSDAFRDKSLVGGEELDSFLTRLTTRRVHNCKEHLNVIRLAKPGVRTLSSGQLSQIRLVC